MNISGALATSIFAACALALLLNPVLVVVAALRGRPTQWRVRLLVELSILAGLVVWSVSRFNYGPLSAGDQVAAWNGMLLSVLATLKYVRVEFEALGTSPARRAHDKRS